MENLRRPIQSFFKSLFKQIGWMVLLAGILQAGLSGCAASDPAGIPAPVSKLIVFSGPDLDGVVTIEGGPESVFNNAIVWAANADLGGNLMDQGSEGELTSSTSVEARPDGSFILNLNAEVGDRILIVQEVNGRRGEITVLEVPEEEDLIGVPTIEP